jgi:hypothetical protein
VYFKGKSLMFEPLRCTPKHLWQQMPGQQEVLWLTCDLTVRTQATILWWNIQSLDYTKMVYQLLATCKNFFNISDVQVTVRRDKFL